MTTTRPLTMLFALGLAVSASAHDPDPTFDRIQFTVSAEDSVSNDTLTAHLYYQREGEKPAELADDVNQTVAWAVKLAKSRAGVHVQTENYQTNPVYRKQTLTGWQVRQGIRLRSQDSTVLSELLAELQTRLAVQSVRYTVSPEARSKVEDHLIGRALANFRHRAELITEEMGRKGYRVVRLDIHREQDRPRNVAIRTQAMSTASKIATPTLETGESILRVNVNAQVELRVP